MHLQALNHRRDSSMSSVAPAIAVIALILVPIAILGPNTGLAFYAILALIVGVATLFRPGEPPVLMLVFGYQWVQASITLFYGNILGLNADFLTASAGQHDRAIFLSLTGLMVLALSIRAAIGRPDRELGDRLLAYIGSYPLSRWFRVFVVSWIVSEICLFLSTANEGIRQPLLFLAQVKWAAFFALTMATFGPSGKPKHYWLIAFCIELAVSVGGYFSSFSDVFFYTLISIGANRRSLSPRTLIPLSVIGSIMLVFGVIWSGVKLEYRDYAAQGSYDQVVSVGYVKRMEKLAELIGQIDGPTFRADVDIMINRLMYFEFFGIVLDRVPSGIPHTEGKLWGQALLLPFTPRLVFPDKPIINDTALTMEYTGINQPAWLKGASISLGYMAEAYIDFGPVLMFVALAALGYAMGAIYRWLLRQEGLRSVIGGALAPLALMPQHALESSIFKMLPPLVLAWIGSWFILNHLGPRIFAFLGSRQAAPGHNSVAFPLRN